MSSDLESVEHLRSDFDKAFLQKRKSVSEEQITLLLIGANGHQLALRTADISGVMRCPSIVALPSEKPGLRGLVGVRGVLAVVYDIAALVNGNVHRETADGWIVLCSADRSVALRFDDLIGYIRIADADLYRTPAGVDRAQNFVRFQDASFSVLDLSRLLVTLAVGNVTIAPER